MACPLMGATRHPGLIGQSALLSRRDLLICAAAEATEIVGSLVGPTARIAHIHLDVLILARLDESAFALILAASFAPVAPHRLKPVEHDADVTPDRLSAQPNRFSRNDLFCLHPAAGNDRRFGNVAVLPAVTALPIPTGITLAFKPLPPMKPEVAPQLLLHGRATPSSGHCGKSSTTVWCTRTRWPGASAGRPSAANTRAQLTIRKWKIPALRSC